MDLPSRAGLIAARAARAAGRIAMAHYRRSGMRVARKGNRRNLVTSVDRACQRAVLRTIRRSSPGARVMAEETPGALRERREGDLWLVDPLDGTLNYVHGCPFFAHSVALVRDGVPLAGAVCAPALREMFTSVRGRGARLNGRPVAVTPVRHLASSLLATGFPHDLSPRFPERSNLGEFSALLWASQGVRRLGSAALDLAYIAAGVFDGYWELALCPWDVAAGVLMVEEAGGRVTHLDGRPFRVFASTKGIAASNGSIHASLISHLRRARGSRWPSSAGGE